MKLIATTMLSAAVALASPAIAAKTPAAHPAATPSTATPPSDTTTASDQTATDATTPASQADAAASAHTAVTAKAGDTVYDNTGIAAGTVESVSGTTFVLVTSAGKATVPLSGLSNGPKGLTIAMTKSQLEEAIRKAKG
jgi:hypothetical protein